MPPVVNGQGRLSAPIVALIGSCVSNINPSPTLPIGGGATAAQGGFPYPGHQTQDKVIWRELKAAAARASAAQRLASCRICKGRSPEWKIGHCPACNNTGLPA